MFIIAALIAFATPESPVAERLFTPPELNVTKKKKNATSTGSGRRFSSCAAARKAGYSHMRRGKAGYSTNLDRDGDGIACDKVR